MLFEFSYKEAAQATIGRTLVTGQGQCVILRAKGFSRASNDAPLYKPMLELRPGDVFTPRRRNAILLLTVCNDGSQSGGCVLIDAIEINGRVIEGPGRVSQALGLEIPKDPGRMVEREDGVLELRMSRLGSPKLPSQPVRKRNSNGLGDAALAKHMPAIAKKFLKLPANGRSSFEEYLNKLLADCHDESMLRRRLRV